MELGVECEDGLLVAPDDEGGRHVPGHHVQPGQVEAARHRPRPDHRQGHHHQGGIAGEILGHLETNDIRESFRL